MLGISTIIFLFFLFATYALFLVVSRKQEADHERLQQRRVVLLLHRRHLERNVGFQIDPKIETMLAFQARGCDGSCRGSGGGGGGRAEKTIH